ncbi:hypothetical protein AHAS_Ahas08G0131500 [Arachis hypogaea]
MRGEGTKGSRGTKCIETFILSLYLQLFGESFLPSVPLGSGGSDWDFDPLFSISPYCIRKFRWGMFGMGSGLPETRNSMENNINNVKTQ